jgi:hypothetical protein
VNRDLTYFYCSRLFGLAAPYALWMFCFSRQHWHEGWLPMTMCGVINLLILELSDRIGRTTR